MPNRYPLWKYLLMIGLFLLGLLYALPNLYGDDPAVQVSLKESAVLAPNLADKVSSALQTNHLNYLKLEQGKHNELLVRFADTDTQLKASDILKATLGNDYIVALNLAPRTPRWLAALGIAPMKLGLDLRGGVHFLIAVDTNNVVKTRQEGDMRNIGDQLRSQMIRYASISISPTTPNSIAIQFRDTDSLDKAKTYLARQFPDYLFTPVNKDGVLQLTATLTQPALTKMTDYALDQTITILNNRINELGVSEAVVQRQGSNQVSVDLPGVQDTARAKDIIGKVAILRFQLVDVQHDVQAALAGNIPFGSRLYTYVGPPPQPILLQNQVILRGSSITYATAAVGQNGRPTVQVTLGGGGESLFQRATASNIGKPLAVVYVETVMQQQMVNGKPVTKPQQIEKVISVASIQSALSNNFEITNLESMQYAQNLALLLRSGSLVAPVDFIQERTVGPSLGKANIHMGVLSVEVGAAFVIIFMICYYRLFGLVADLALVLNIIFIIAILSVLGATLTLPGIAAIVLTVGMAVDANVLINERIREELRNGASPQASIQTGYSRAFTTIVDANVSTLIVALILFALGSGSVKGFAVILIIGLLTSMVTAIFFTRGIINLIYGGRSVKSLSIGIKVPAIVSQSFRKSN
ncbi:MAG: protein translocase subunit SecD [Gammaproteobacteria bacterium]